VVADKTAVTILERVGYDAESFVLVLEALKGRADARGRGLLQSHPEPDARVRVVRESATARKPPPPPATQERFSQALKGV
jgi:predicted Zn-dependent protease